MMAGPLEKGRDVARKLGTPEHIVVTDAGHAAGKRMRDFEGFGDPASPKNALLYEAGQHWEAISGPRSIEVALRFLQYARHVTDLTLRRGFSREAAKRPAEQQVIEVTGPVTIEAAEFTFADAVSGYGESWQRQAHLSATMAARPIVTPYDRCVLIMPSRRLWKGQTAVTVGPFYRRS